MTNFWKKLKKPIIGLCPMDGVTDLPRRQIQCQIQKPDVMYTEFINVDGLTRNSDKCLRKLSFKENERPIVVQLYGFTPELFYLAIKKIIPLGFDGIDLNMGCPARKIINKGGGGALIGDYKLAKETIEKSLQAIKESNSNIPLSVKTRIGKKEAITKDWFSFLTQFSLSEITIHGRLLNQGLSGLVNWEEIGKAAKIIHKKGIVCLGNGGIKSLKEAKEKAEKYKLDGVLIGQAALSNPWIFKNDYQASREDIFKLILDHAKLTSRFYPPKGFTMVLKHFCWYCQGFPNSKQLKIQLLKTRSFKEVQEVIADFKAGKLTS